MIASSPALEAVPSSYQELRAYMGTSVSVKLGNDKNFIFDVGPDSVANYLAAGVPLNQINDICLTHLHWDHVASVPYGFVFGLADGMKQYRITFFPRIHLVV